MEERYLKVLRKKAMGYTVRERVSEYSAEDGTLTEIRRKIQTKHVPADLSALKFLIELDVDVSRMTDEELETERRRLLNLLGEEQRDKNPENGD